jgi:peptidoglycan/LPS O-acetylase OafA/YrhL
VLQYRADIQGLRAIAVVMVVVFHAWPDLLTGGYIGVDVFFVLSGFLISSILLRDLDAGLFSIADFYRRRVRRIFPALFTVLIATLIWGWVVLEPNGYKWLVKTVATAVLFVSNFEFFRSLDYFSPTAETIPLLHTWSLAVEEQYYLVFLLALWGLVRHPEGRRHVFAVICIVAFVGIALSHWAVTTLPQAAYYLLPFRLFELLFGVMAAFAPLPKGMPQPMREVMAGVGLLTVLACAVFYTPETPFPGLWAALPTAATALVFYAGRTGGSLTARLLSLKPMLFIGGISYALYLWHWPLMAFARLDAPYHEVPHVQMTLIIGLTVLLAWMTYRFIEQPVMRQGISALPFLRLGGAALASITVVSGAIYLADGLAGRFPEASHRAFSAARNYSPKRYECHQTDVSRRPYAETCILNGADQANVVVWGDSHGTELAYALQNQFGTVTPVRQVTSSACPPVIDPEVLTYRNCVAENAKFLTALSADTAAKEVILAMNRMAYDEEDEAALARGYEATVRHLIEAGKRVVLMQQIPDIDMPAPRRVGLAVMRG